MKINSLVVNNFLGLAEASLSLDGRGLVLVEGVNHDSPTAISNGAGKSSIYEALYWAFFGKTKRGLTGDDVINETAGKDCFVEVYFDDYRLVRFRKHDFQGGTGLRLWARSKDPGEMPIEITKGTIKETQELLESIIRMSEVTFAKVTHFGQGDVKAFASLTDAELKQVFEQALGITYFTDYLARAKAHKGAKEAVLADIQQGILKAEADKKHAEEKIAILEAAQKELDAKHRREMDRLSGEIASNDAELATVMGRDCFSIEEIDRDIAKRRDLLDKRAALVELRGKLQTSMTAEQIKLTTAKTRHEATIDDAKKAIKELQAAEAKVGKECGECGKEYAAGDIAGFKTSILARLEALKAQAAGLAAGAGEQGAKVKHFEDLMAKLEGELSRFDDVRVEVAELEGRRTRVIEKERQIAGLKVKRAEVERMIASLRAEISAPRTVNTAAEVAKVAEIDANMAKLLAELDGLKTYLEDVGAICEILGNQGLKSYIFDAVTPELNRLIQEYMGILNPDIRVEISTVSKLKSGDFREKFAIKVANASGADSFDGSSGGEKQIINLAIALAFNKVVRGMAGGACNVLFLDEPFESLDADACERAIELCQKFAAGIPSVFIISHNPAIKDLVGSSIVVEKSGGAAKIKVA